MTRLVMLLQPWSGTSLRLMIGMPSRSSSAARIVAYCTTSGTTFRSTHSLLSPWTSGDEPVMVLERQRHVDLVGPRALHRVARVRDRPDHAEAGVSDGLLALAQEADARGSRDRRCATSTSATVRPSSPVPATSTRVRFSPAAHCRSCQERSAARPKLSSSTSSTTNRANTAWLYSQSGETSGW